METKISVALNNQSKGQHCGREAALEATEKLGAYKPTLALMFTSHSQPTEVAKGVRSILGDIPLIGSTSAGEYSHSGYVEDGVGLMLVSSTNIQFHLVAQQRRLFRFGSLLGRLQGTTPDGLRSIYHHRTLMLFPDDSSASLKRVVDQAVEETAMLYNIIGGPSPTLPTPPYTPLLFHNDRVFRAGLTGTEILSSQPIGAAIANGWTPIRGPYRVTKADDRHIFKLDGRPAKEIYEDFALEQGIPIDKALPSDFVLHHPIGLCDKGDCRVSLVMGFDNDGALKMTSPPNVGSLVHILGTEPTAMVTAAQRAIRQAVTGLEGAVSAGALFIDCMSSAMLFEHTYPQQRAIVQVELGATPFLGYRSHGVLARLVGQISGHYECSVGACLFPNRRLGA